MKITLRGKNIEITEAIEEKEREGFIRLKVIKNQKQDSIQ